MKWRNITAVDGPANEGYHVVLANAETGDIIALQTCKAIRPDLRRAELAVAILSLLNGEKPANPKETANADTPELIEEAALEWDEVFREQEETIAMLAQQLSDKKEIIRRLTA